MKYTSMILLLVLFSCDISKLTDLEKSGTEYFATFTHNGSVYTYNSEVSISTLIESDSLINLFVVSDFFGDSIVDFSLVIATQFPLDFTNEQIKNRLIGEQLATINDNDIEPGVIYFIPIFYLSESSGFIQPDGNGSVYVNIIEQSTFYEQDGAECFDLTIEFEVFANIPLLNSFNDGLAKTRICL